MQQGKVFARIWPGSDTWWCWAMCRVIGMKRPAIAIEEVHQLISSAISETYWKTCFVLVDSLLCSSSELGCYHVYDPARVVVDELDIPVNGICSKMIFFFLEISTVWCSSISLVVSRQDWRNQDHLSEALYSARLWFCGIADGLPVYDGEQIQIGGNETYIPVCRKHYFAPEIINKENEENEYLWSTVIVVKTVMKN